MPTGLLTAFGEKRDALISTAMPGTRSARVLADEMDAVVRALAGTTASSRDAGFVIFATGGYGAGRLLPHSDIDLLVVSHGRVRELEHVVRQVVYPLWDLGLSVGHQVRSPSQHVRALSEDIENLTAFLTARPIAGDFALGDRVTAMAFQRMRRDAPRIRRALLARERTGSPYLLEPDLKSGAGGQRDLDELVWHAALHAGTTSGDAAALVGAGVLSGRERDALTRAQDTLTAARWRLHVAHGRAQNTFALEAALIDGMDADAVQQALAIVHHTLLDARDRLVDARPPAVASLDMSTLREIASAGVDRHDALERLAWHGAFDAAVPGFSELMAMRRPALTHRLTVGAHCLGVLTALADRPIRSTELYDALLVAALTHDTGKRDPAPGHAARGADTAAQAARNLGCAPHTAKMAATLVREHLLLAEVATHQDIADEDVVLAAASRLGDYDLVSALYDLTEADMRATAPDVWTPWRAALIVDLAAKLEAALAPESDGPGLLSAAEHTRSEAIRRASSAGASRTVIAFCEHAPVRYLARRTPDEVLRDARLVQSLAGPGRIGEFALDVRAASSPGTWLVDIVTRDRAGLFSTLAGVIALGGLDVVAAEAFTAPGGIALDTFTVVSATRAPADDETWAILSAALADLLGRPEVLETRLAERRRHYPVRPNGRAAAPQVEIVSGNPYSTAVRVRTADRVGLLHDLARAFGLFGLDIRRATIATAAGVADDVFEVVDASGEPPSADRLADTLVPALTDAAAT